MKKEKSKRINQLKITLIDNFPDMGINHWYSGWEDSKPKYKGRYKLNMWLLTSHRPVTLQSTLSWPPSDLARRLRWREHKQQYEVWRRDSQNLKDDVNRDSPIPPLLGMPSEYQTVQTKQKGKMHKWYVPDGPSLTRVQLLRDNGKPFWNIQWLLPEQTLEFVLNPEDCDIAYWDNKKGGQSRVYTKTYAHAFNVHERFYMPTHQEVFIQEDIDPEYESFKERLKHLFSLNNELAEVEAMRVMKQFQSYTERYASEMQA